MKVLVTGGKGFIGSALVKKLLEFEHSISVSVLDIADGGNMLTYIKKGMDYDIIFNCCALTDVKDSIDRPFDYFMVNAWAVYRLFDIFKDKRLVNISSCVADPMTSPYGLSKKLSEVITDYFPNSVSCRLYNVFGETCKNHIIYYWAQKMLNNEDVPIVGDGLAERDYIYIDDAINAVIKYGLGNSKGVVQIGYSKTTNALQLFKLMADYYGYKKEPVFAPVRAGDQRITVSNNNVGGIGFEEGLKRTLAHLQAEYVCLK
jgi:UDP-glucose 4-epimerase